MKLKNILPYFIAHQFFEYNSHYMQSIVRGYDKDIEKNLLDKNYFFGELDIVYYMAINHKRTNIVNLFEDKIHINKTKKLFVYEAAKMNYSHIVENYLIKKRMNKKSKFLFLLLEIATLHSSYETIELLLKYGVDFTQNHYACVRTILSAGNFELFKLFHQYNLDIKKNEYIFTAIIRDNKEWFNYLLHNGFQINETNKNVIYNFLSFSGSLNIIEAEKANFIHEKENMLKACNYNPLSKKWFDSFYKKVDFYKKLEDKFINKEPVKNKKIQKI